MKPRYWPINGVKGSPIFLEARVVLEDRTVAQQADIGSISVKFWYAGSVGDAYSATPVVAESIFDELQDWDEDDTGYNMRVKIPGSEVAASGEVLAEVNLIPAGGDGDDAVRVLFRGSILSSHT